MAAGAIAIRGLAELQRDFRKMSGDLGPDTRRALREAARPVAERAQARALGEIRNMPRSPRWARMRIGVSPRSVYIVPSARRRRGARGGRPNLAGLLFDRAMEPALDDEREALIEGLGRMFDRLAGGNGF